MIGDVVTVTVDRPMGSFHPEHKDMFYPINYGCIEGVIAPDGEEQDARKTAMKLTSPKSIINI